MKNEPLGLPHGSIRAIFLLLFSIPIVISFFVEADIPPIVINTWVAIVSFYFGLRSNFDCSTNDKK